MWKLKTGAETVREERNNDDESGGSTGSETWLRTLNGHLGRQVWEFHPELGTPEELQQIEDARRGFSDRRFEKRHSSDLLMRIQPLEIIGVWEMLTSAAKSMRDKHLSRLKKTLLMIMVIFLPGVLKWGEKIVANGEGSTVTTKQAT